MNPHQYDFATPNRKRGFLVFSALGLIKTALKSCQAFPFNTQDQEECVCHGITLSNHKTFLSSLKAHPPHGSNSLGALTSASGRNPPMLPFFVFIAPSEPIVSSVCFPPSPPRRTILQGFVNNRWMRAVAWQPADRCARTGCVCARVLEMWLEMCSLNPDLRPAWRLNGQEGIQRITACRSWAFITRGEARDLSLLHVSRWMSVYWSSVSLGMYLSWSPAVNSLNSGHDKLNLTPAPSAYLSLSLSHLPLS